MDRVNLIGEAKVKPKVKGKASVHGHQEAGKATSSLALGCAGGPQPGKAKRATKATADVLPVKRPRTERGPFPMPAQRPDYAHVVSSWATALPLGQRPNAYYLADLVARLEGVGPMDRKPDVGSI